MFGKKLIFIALIVSFVCLPFLSQAINPGSIPGAKDLGISQESPIQGPGGLLNVVAGIVKWVYTLFFVIAVLFILFAAFNYLTAGGQPEKVKSAQDQLLYAAIAIAIALMAIGVTAIIKNVLEGKTSSSSPTENNYYNYPNYEAPPGTSPNNELPPGTYNI